MGTTTPTFVPFRRFEQRRSNILKTRSGPIMVLRSTKFALICSVSTICDTQFHHVAVQLANGQTPRTTDCVLTHADLKSTERQREWGKEREEEHQRAHITLCTAVGNYSISIWYSQRLTALANVQQENDGASLTRVGDTDFSPVRQARLDQRTNTQGL